MINALARGKFKLITGLKEDTLTSSVLDYLLLLPDSMIWDILRNSNPKNSDLPIHVGRYLNSDFWPNWDTKDMEEVNNIRYIEPDVFIEFEGADVIIEAKRHDSNQQSSSQWSDQIKVYNENISDHIHGKPLIYFALGGLWDDDVKKLQLGNDEYFIYKIRWRQLMEKIIDYKESIEQTLEIVPNSGSYVRILQTILDALALHGYYISKHIWFDTIDISQNRTINLTHSLNNIKQWNLQKA